MKFSEASCAEFQSNAALYEYYAYAHWVHQRVRRCDAEQALAMTTMAFSGTMEVKDPSIFGERWGALHGELAAAAGGGVELRLFAQAGDAEPARAAFGVARATDVPERGGRKRLQGDLHPVGAQAPQDEQPLDRIALNPVRLGPLAWAA